MNIALYVYLDVILISCDSNIGVRGYFEIFGSVV